MVVLSVSIFVVLSTVIIAYFVSFQILVFWIYCLSSMRLI